MATYRGTDGDDFFGFPDNTGDDSVEAGGGNDTILGGQGDDYLKGQGGDDFIDGGAGEDRVRAGSGDDVGVFTLAENTLPSGEFNEDSYDGDRGFDTLRLFFTADEFRTHQADIVALQSFIRSHQDTGEDDRDSSTTYTTSFGLEASNWERLEVFVDGVLVDPVNPAPTLDLDANDSSAAGTGFATTFIEGGKSVPVVDQDVQILDLGGQLIHSATVTLVSRPDGDDEHLRLSGNGDVIAAGANIQVSKSEPAGDDGSFVLTFTGFASASIYENLLKEVRYANSSLDPDKASRLVQVVVSDGTSDSNVAVATVGVVAINDPPVNALPDSVTLLEDESAPIAASVSDPDASKLRVTLEVSQGTLSLAPTDSVVFIQGDGVDDRRIVMEGSQGDLNEGLAGLVYTPDPDFAGSDRLTVLTEDFGRGGSGGPLQDQDEVELVVTPVNDRPSLVLHGDLTVEEDSGLQVVPNFALAEPGGGPDEADQTFTFVLRVDNPDLFAVAPTIDASGTLYFEPAEDANGTATIQVNAKDSGGSELGTATSPTRTFTITVEPDNDEPELFLQGDRIVLEDSGPASFPGFATAHPGGGDDEADQTVGFSVEVDRPELFEVGPAIDASGELTFTPAPDASGTTSVKVKAIDSGGEESDGERFDITINPVNDAPTLSLAGDVIVAEDSGPHTFGDFAESNPGGGPDELGQDFFYTVETDNTALFVQAPTISGRGNLSFSLAPNATGSANVTVRVTDDGGTADGGVDTSEPQTFRITVNPVNDAPSLTILGNQSTTEDSGRQVVPGFATAFAGGGEDEAGQTFTYRVLTLNPSLFAVSPTIAADGTLSYTPRADAVGSTRVLVSVVDSGGRSGGGVDGSPIEVFTITINPVNDAPSFSLGKNPIVAEDAGPQSIANFATPDAGGGRDEGDQTFRYTVTADNPDLFQAGPAIDPNGTLTFTPQGDANGSSTVTVFVTDSGGTAGGGQNTSSTRTFTITVNPVNDPPLLFLQGDQSVNEDTGDHEVVGFASASPGGAGGAEEGSSFRYQVSVTDHPELFERAPSISPEGALSYTLRPDAAGTATVEVRVSDDGGTADGGRDTSAPQTFTITVNPVNDRPTLAVKGHQSVLEDSGPQEVQGFAIPNAGGGADETSQTFSYDVRTDDPTLFSRAPSIDSAGTLRYQIAPDRVGEATVTVIATDSGGTDDGGVDTSAPVSFRITSNPVNDEPTFTLKGDQAVLEDAGPQTVSDFAVTDAGGGPDEAGQTFSYDVRTDRPELFAVAPAIDPTGALTYTPAPDVVGKAEVTVQVTDSGGTADGGDPTSGVKTFSITMNPVNDRPTLVLAGDQVVTEDSGLHSVAGFARPNAGGGADERFQKFRYEVVVSDNPALFAQGPQIDETGRLVYSTNPDTNGEASVVVRVTDDGGTADGGVDTSQDVAFRIVVNPVNDEPTFTLLGDRSVLEDSGAQSIAGFAVADPGGGPDEIGQTFSYLVENNRPDLFAVAPTIDPEGTLQFTPAPDAVGTATVSVRVTDSGGTADGGDATSSVQTFAITLNPVNDEPTLVLGGDRIVGEDAGPQKVPGFARPNAGGGPDEGHQRFSYAVVVVENPDLFVKGPEIDASGQLSFETKKDAIGEAIVAVRVTDDGGTADGGADTSSEVRFRVVVNPVNDPPSFSLLGNQSAREDSGAQLVDAFASANPGGGPDESGQLVTWDVSTNRPELFEKAPSISPSGILSYTPARDAVGTATVTVKAIDDGGTADGGNPVSAPQSFTITLNPVNDAPSLTVAGDQIVSEDGGPHSVANFARPNSGGGADEVAQSFSYDVTTDRPELFKAGPQIDSTGRLTFTTQEDGNGTANVTVRAIDSGGTANGGQNTSPDVQFRIIVNPVNDAPSLSLGGDRIVVEDSGSQVIAGFATADPGGGSDELAQSLSYNVTSDKRELFAEAPAIAPDGTLTFTPQRDATGTATVTVVATDNGGTSNGGRSTSLPKQFTITLNPVNDPPSFTLLGDRISNEDAGLQTVRNFASATPGGGPDEANQTFNYTVTTDRPELFSVQPSIAPDGTLTYATQKDTVGTAPVRVVVRDSGGTANGGRDLSDPQTFSITVNPVNDAPSLTLLGNQITVEDAGPRNVTGFAKPSPGGGPDEAGQTFFYNVTTTNPQLFAEAPSISPAGVLSYTPAADANGVATVSVVATDSGGTANGGQDTSAPRTFTITVNKVNDPPVLVVGGDQTVLEDARVQVVPNFASALPGGGPDEIGQTFRYNVNLSPQSLDLFTIAPAIDNFGRLTYQPRPDAAGTALVEVVAVDDGGTADGGNPFSAARTFAINISGVNDAPLLSLAGNVVADEDSGQRVVAAFATASPGGGADEQGQTFTYDVRTDKPGLFSEAPTISPTGTLSFTPARDATGVATVEVNVTDSGGTANGGQNRSATQTFTITLNPVNDPPRVTLKGNVSDVEDGGANTVTQFATATPGGGPEEATQKVTFSVVGNDNPGLFAVAPSIDGFGNLSYVLNPDVVGSAEISVRGTDNGGTANGGNPVSELASFRIDVAPVNDRPTLTLGGTRIVNEDAGAQTVLDFATAAPGGGADEAGQTFRYTVTTNKPALFAAGPSISPGGDLTFTPARDAVGNADVTVTAIDSGGTANGGQDTSLPRTFSIVINPVNDPPVFTLLGERVVLEDAPLQMVPGFAVGNPGGGPDEAGQRFTYNVTNDNPQLFKVAPTISDTGTLAYQVNPDMIGTAEVTVTATDDGGTGNGGQATSAAQTFRITVNPVNDRPSFVLQGDLVVHEDVGPQQWMDFATAFPGGGPDEAAQTFTYTANTDRLDLFDEAPWIDPDGTLRFTPRADAWGLATVSVRLTDDGGTADGGVNQSLTQHFTIFVDPINDAPVNRFPTVAIPTEDQVYRFASGSAGGISVSDVDAQTLEVSLSVSSGTLTVTTTDGFALSSRQLVLTASPDALNGFLASLTYAPNPNFHGTDRLAIVTRDYGETGAGGPLQDVDTVTLSVQPVNDAPFIAVPGAQWTQSRSLEFSSANSNQITIDDADAGTNDLATILSVTGGTLSLVVEGLRISGDRLAFNADLAALNDALDGLVYTASPGTTQDRLSLFVDDLGNTGKGGPLQHAANIQIWLDDPGDAMGLVGVPDAGLGDYGA